MGRPTIGWGEGCLVGSASGSGEGCGVGSGDGPGDKLVVVGAVVAPCSPLLPVVIALALLLLVVVVVVCDVAELDKDVFEAEADEEEVS